MILSRFERMVVRRYLLPQKGEGFIFVVAGFSVVAVALGVMALVVVMSIMNGFRAELFNKIAGVNGHAVIQGYNGQLPNWQQVADAARKTPGVTSALPLIDQPLMASSNGRVEGVLVRGMRVQDLLSNETINSNVVAGDLRAITPGSGRIAIGSGLANRLGAGPGSEISLISPEGRSTVVGTVPRIVTYTVGAVFEVGIYDYDKAFVIMPMEDAQSLLMLGDSVGLVEVQTSDPDRVREILAPLQATVVRNAVVVDWRQMNSALFSALDLERVVMFVVVSIIGVVAAFNIASSMIMLVRSKTRDIAILRTMGSTRRSIQRIFMTVGLSIGVTGIVIGLLLGAVILFFRQGFVAVVHNLTGVDPWDPSVRILTKLPAQTDLLEVTLILVVTLVLVFLASLFPALRAARTDPVQVLRYE
ncbi:MAG TPA: lipoprotein-releasing ABC transporter permease subunit [Sphingomicrobium sp.]|nr:lipoprotein-releasing ABC transporter permease subunit [Sphingomicrobium sp.]